MKSANQLFWLWTAGAVDKVKHRVKGSPHLHAIPFLHATYLLEIPKAIDVAELNMIYVPIAKVANRSIKAAIAERIGLTYRNHPNEAAWRYIPLPAVAKRSDCFRFSIVRNPLDRLLSCYTQKIVVYRNTPNARWEFWRYGNRFHGDMQFDEFVSVVAKIPDALSDIHFRSQHTFVCHRGRLVLDSLGHFETLHDDWRELRERFDLPALPHQNKSPHRDFRDVYTPELARLAAARYEKDVRLFGYEEAVSALTD